MKPTRELPENNEFVAYIDALGELDGKRGIFSYMGGDDRSRRRRNGAQAFQLQFWRARSACQLQNLAGTVWHRISRREVLHPID